MPKSSRQIIKDSINTSTLTSGLLNPEQASQFLKMTFDVSNLSKRVRHIIRRSKTGEIDKVGIGSRLLRKKVEDTDDNYRAKPKFGKVEYATTPVRLPWEMTEETLRENIEGAKLEQIITELMTTQLGIDKMDLHINGDASLASVKAFSSSAAYSIGDKVIYNKGLYEFTKTHAAGAFSESDVNEIGTQDDVDFLKINDGWIKLISEGGHTFDNDGKTLNLDLFYKTSQLIARKYHQGLEWIMHPIVAQNWERILLNAYNSNGSTLPDRIFKAPAGIPITEEINMPTDKIILANPQNLIDVNTYSVNVRKTTEGKEAIMQDKRFYVTHFDFDSIIEEVEATAIISNVNSAL